MVMGFYGWEPLTLSHQSANLGDFRHCSSCDEMFPICHVIWKGHMFKGLCHFMSGIPS